MKCPFDIYPRVRCDNDSVFSGIKFSIETLYITTKSALSTNEYMIAIMAMYFYKTANPISTKTWEIIFCTFIFTYFFRRNVLTCKHFKYLPQSPPLHLHAIEQVFHETAFVFIRVHSWFQFLHAPPPFFRLSFFACFSRAEMVFR